MSGGAGGDQPRGRLHPVHGRTRRTTWHELAAVAPPPAGAPGQGVHPDAARPHHLRDDARGAADPAHAVRLRDQQRPEGAAGGDRHREPRPVQPGDDLGAGADRLLPLQPRHRQRRRGGGADPARRRRLRRHHPVGLRRPGGARRPAADPGRGRRHRPGGGERRDLDARHRRRAGAPARDRRGGGGGRGGARPARGRRPPALQPRGHLAVQHRAGAAGGHPADDDGDDDLDGADPRDRARHDGEPARDAGDGERGDALEDPALPRGRRGAGDGGAARRPRALRGAVRRAARRAHRRGLRLRAGAGAARLRDLELRADPDAGDAADVLLLPAVALCSRGSCSRSAACRAGRRCSASSSRSPISSARSGR